MEGARNRSRPRPGQPKATVPSWMAAVVMLCLVPAAVLGARQPDVDITISKLPADFAKLQTETVEVTVDVRHPEFSNGFSCKARGGYTSSAANADFVALFLDGACVPSEDPDDSDVWKCPHAELLSSWTGSEWITGCERGEQTASLSFSAAAAKTVAARLSTDALVAAPTVSMRAWYCKNDRQGPGLVSGLVGMFSTAGEYSCFFPSDNEMVVVAKGANGAVGKVAARAVCGDIRGKGMKTRCALAGCNVTEWWWRDGLHRGRVRRGPHRVTCEAPRGAPLWGLYEKCPAEPEIKVPKGMIEEMARRVGDFDKATGLAVSSNGQEFFRQILRDVPGGMLTTYDSLREMAAAWQDPARTSYKRESVKLAGAILLLVAKNVQSLNPLPAMGLNLGVTELTMGALLSPACLDCMRTPHTMTECLVHFVSRQQNYEITGTEGSSDTRGLKCSSQFFIIFLTGLNLKVHNAEGKDLTTARPMSIYGVESWKTFRWRMVGRLTYSAAILGAFTYAWYDPNDAVTLSTVAYAKIGIETIGPALVGLLKKSPDILSKLGGAVTGMVGGARRAVRGVLGLKNQSPAVLPPLTLPAEEAGSGPQYENPQDAAGEPELETDGGRVKPGADTDLDVDSGDELGGLGSLEGLDDSLLMSAIDDDGSLYGPVAAVAAALRCPLAREIETGETPSGSPAGGRASEQPAVTKRYTDSRGNEVSGDQ